MDFEDSMLCARNHVQNITYHIIPLMRHARSRKSIERQHVGSHTRRKRVGGRQEWSPCEGSENIWKYPQPVTAQVWTPGHFQRVSCIVGKLYSTQLLLKATIVNSATVRNWDKIFWRQRTFYHGCGWIRGAWWLQKVELFLVDYTVKFNVLTDKWALFISGAWGGSP